MIVSKKHCFSRPCCSKSSQRQLGEPSSHLFFRLRSGCFSFLSLSGTARRRLPPPPFILLSFAPLVFLRSSSPFSPLRHPRLHLHSASSPVPTLSPTSLSRRHRVIAGKTGGVPTVAVHTLCCSDSQDCLHGPTAAFSTRKQGCNQRETTSILQTLLCGFPLKKNVQ